MDFKKITEQNSNYNNIEQLSIQEILENINEEDQKVSLAVKKSHSQYQCACRGYL